MPIIAAFATNAPTMGFGYFFSSRGALRIEPMQDSAAVELPEIAPKMPQAQVQPGPAQQQRAKGSG